MYMHLISITTTEPKKKNKVTNKNVHDWQSHILKYLITVLGLLLISLHKQQKHVLMNRAIGFKNIFIFFSP